jgi:hypothetical protein
LINADIDLNNAKLAEYARTKRISINAEAYLTTLQSYSDSESKRLGFAQFFKTENFNFEGSHDIVRQAHQLQSLFLSTENSQLKKYSIKQLLNSPAEPALQISTVKTETTKKWPGRLTNAAGRISMLHGGYSTIQALNHGDTTGFALGAGEMGFSLFSQLIEDGIVKIAPKFIKQMKGGMYLARGSAGLITAPFDIYDLVRSSIELSEAPKGSKAWRDSICINNLCWRVYCIFSSIYSCRCARYWNSCWGLQLL